MEPYTHNGIIELGIIENTGDNADQIGLLTVNFNHYPDCQQLVAWLPEYGRSGYGHYRIIDKNTNTILENALVEDKLGGSVQLIFDTLGIYVGTFLLEIEHPKSGKHVLHFQKFAEESPLRDPNEMGAATSEPDSPFEISDNLFLGADIINQALAFSSEWGENYQKPIFKRMREKYPEMSSETIEILQAYVNKAEYHIYYLAEQSVAGKVKESEIGILARRQFPWLNHANASRLAGIGMYYTTK